MQTHLTDSSVSPGRKLGAEFLGTSILLCATVGSGIMGARLSPASIAQILLVKSIASSAMLTALLFTFAPISGAHLNPLVTFLDFLQGKMEKPLALAYVASQCLGAVVGTASAHLMFGLPVLAVAHTPRTGGQQWLGEFIASLGLIAVILGCRKASRLAAPLAIGLYLLAAFWFTSSSSFANPALTLACALSDTFSGIRLQDVPGFMVAQLLGGGLGAYIMMWLQGIPMPRTLRRLPVVERQVQRQAGDA